jgi:peptidoglycan/xylan/chitin deacetylase (PgdA/CDA1 family)
MRSLLKNLFETLLLRGGLATIRSNRLAGRTLILAYHNILPEGSHPGGDASLHLPVRAFAAQLDQLRKTCDVVPLSEIQPDTVEASTRSRRPRVVITFDDAYQGALTVGLDELRRRSLPATIFVAPGFLPGKTFWWDAVPLAPEGRHRALQDYGGKDKLVRAWGESVGLKLREPDLPARAATLEQLDEAMNYSSLQLGSHTWSHPALSALGPEELSDELSRSLTWLTERYDRVSRWISYPYGLTSPAVEAAAARAGYEGGLLVQGGWILREPASRFQIPRLNIPAGLSPRGFALRLSGIFSQ